MASGFHREAPFEELCFKWNLQNYARSKRMEANAAANRYVTSDFQATPVLPLAELNVMAKNSSDRARRELSARGLLAYSDL
jgi:hypothetical protein